jgi:hypothetical protein
MNGSPVSSLSPEVRELLTVIRDALDLPYPADPADYRKREVLRSMRVICAVASLSFLLADEGATVEDMARRVRANLDGYPVDYVAEGMEPATLDAERHTLNGARGAAEGRAAR